MLQAHPGVYGPLLGPVVAWPRARVGRAVPSPPVVAAAAGPPSPSPSDTSTGEVSTEASESLDGGEALVRSGGSDTTGSSSSRLRRLRRQRSHARQREERAERERARHVAARSGARRALEPAFVGGSSGGHAGDAIPAAESAAFVGGDVEGVVAAVAAASHPVAWAHPNDRFYMAPNRLSSFPTSMDAALAHPSGAPVRGDTLWYGHHMRTLPPSGAVVQIGAGAHVGLHMPRSRGFMCPSSWLR